LAWPAFTWGTTLGGEFSTRGSVSYIMGTSGAMHSFLTLTSIFTSQNFTLIEGEKTFGSLCVGPQDWALNKNNASVRVYKLIREMKVKTRYESQDAIPTDRSLGNGLSKSVIVRTRKMVNYTWVGWSQGKLWWKLVAILTCKSFVKLEYRGERLIEPSSSWFPPKFLSG